MARILIADGRERAARALMLSATVASPEIELDGAAVPWLTLTAPTGVWVAVRRHDDLVLTLSARDGGVGPDGPRIEPIADPMTSLLRSEAPA